jgi:hypothetical protein
MELSSQPEELNGKSRVTGVIFQNARRHRHLEQNGFYIPPEINFQSFKPKPNLKIEFCPGLWART